MSSSAPSLSELIAGSDAARTAIDVERIVDCPFSLSLDDAAMIFPKLESRTVRVRLTYRRLGIVLRHGLVEPDTVILDRNSYDLDREPYRTSIARDAAKRREAAHEISGSWSESLHHIACLKSFDRIATRLRRLTTGEISDAVLSDEDYIEVLWMRRDGRGGSFGATDLLEARLSAADAALEERIDSRARRGPFPSYEELLWRASRRDAEMALRDAGVPVRVVTTTGRVRS